MEDESPGKYRQWVAANFDSDVKEQLFDIYKESIRESRRCRPHCQNHRESVYSFARLSHDQEKVARWLIGLTIALLLFTVALLVFTVCLYKDTHALLKHEEAAKPSAVEHQ